MRRQRRCSTIEFSDTTRPVWLPSMGNTHKLSIINWIAATARDKIRVCQRVL
jgi:hypothetical protein